MSMVWSVASERVSRAEPMAAVMSPVVTSMTLPPVSRMRSASAVWAERAKRQALARRMALVMERPLNKLLENNQSPAKRRWQEIFSAGHTEE